MNELIKQLGEPMYYCPIHVWADIYQPSPQNAMANPQILKSLKQKMEET